MTPDEKAQEARALALQAEIDAIVNGDKTPRAVSPRDFTNQAAAEAWREAQAKKNKSSQKKSKKKS